MRIPRRFLNLLKPTRGAGLPQVLVAVGITGVLVSVMAAMTTSQARENRALTEKLAALDLQRLLTSVISDAAVCTYIVLNGSSQTFSATDMAASNNVLTTPINLGTHLRSTAASDGPVIAEVGTGASPISTSLKVASIELADISCQAPCDPVATASFNAKVRINFDNTKTVRGVPPATSQIVLQTSGGATKTITGCSGAAGGGSSSLKGYQVISQFIPVCNTYVNLCCPGSKKLLGGACYSDWGWCSSTALSASCFAGVAWTGYAGGSQCGSGIQIMITCAD